MYRPHLDFALDLHRRLPADGNLAWSPYSVASALGLAAAGAGNATGGELVRALAPGGDLDELGRLLTASADPEGALAAVANSLWMALGTRFREPYQRAVLGWPGGRLHTVDLRGDPEGSRLKINSDVAGATHGLIEDLIPPGTIHPDIAAVIVNALYLKVAWRSPFPAAATRPADFHAPSGTRPVPTMYLGEQLGYAAAGGWRMVTLPAGGDVMVDVLLPDGPGVPLPDRDVPLTAGALTALYAAAAPARVDLALPRFSVAGAALLKDVLTGMGVRDAFDSVAADFSGITPVSIWIDEVAHKAVLRADEQGFEGAAATAVMMRTVSLVTGEPVPFHVDRPFLVLVRHAGTGAIYFLARVAEP